MRLPMVQFQEGDDNVDDAFNRMGDLSVFVSVGRCALSAIFPRRPPMLEVRLPAQFCLAEGRKEQQRCEKSAGRERARVALLPSKGIFFYGSWLRCKIGVLINVKYVEVFCNQLISSQFKWSR